MQVIIIVSQANYVKYHKSKYPLTCDYITLLNKKTMFLSLIIFLQLAVNFVMGIKSPNDMQYFFG
jgi:hypothetical protein